MTVLTPDYSPRDSIRYGWKHSILRGGWVNGNEIKDGQRLSIMVRVSTFTVHADPTLTQFPNIESSTRAVILTRPGSLVSAVI